MGPRFERQEEPRHPAGTLVWARLRVTPVRGRHVGRLVPPHAAAASCVLLALALGIAGAPVSEAEAEDGGESAEEVSLVDEPGAEAADARTETERPPRPPVARDVFVPSEEISEDVEVPFPVDI